MKKPSSNTARTWLKQQAAPFRKAITLVVVLSIVQFGVQLWGLYCLADILAAAVVEGLSPPFGSVALLGGIFATQLVLAKAIYTVKTRLAAKVSQRFDGILKTRLQHDSLATLRDQSLATWQSYFLHRIPALQNYYCDYRPQQMLATVIPLIVLAAALPFSWLVALVLLVSAPLIPLFMWIVGVGAAVVHREQFKAIERLSSVFLDRLNARQLLHIYKRVDAEQGFFGAASEDLKQRTMKVVSLAFLSSSVLDFFATIAMALVAVFIGFNLLGELNMGTWQGELALHHALFLLLLTPTFFKELKTLGRYYHTKADAEGAAEDLVAVINDERTTAQGRVYTQLPIDLRGFTVFGTQNNAIATAKQLSLREGDHVLFKGPSGAGKSTLLEGLLGFRPSHSLPNSLSNQQDSALLNPRCVAWLSQTPVVLAGSVRDNLALGESFSDLKLLHVLQRVELGSWLQQLPQGLDTEFGDYPPLSGGQRQRLAIARMLLFDKPIVFLDEPTANLSLDQKQRIDSLLEQCFANKTLVWIAHDRDANPFFNRYWQIDANGVVQQHTEEGRLCKLAN